jgi:rod shape-determining protein MreC
MRRRPVASTSFPARTGSAGRRRLALFGLVFLSLALLSVYFRESADGALHDAQSAGASVLHPFQVSAERVAQPFEDASGWVGDVLGAKSENKRLRKENDRLRQQAIQNQTAVRQNAELRRFLRYLKGPTFPRDYRGVAAQIIGRTPGQFEQQVVVAAGRTDGIALNDPVVVPDGLVGKVTKVSRSNALVTLLTDETSAVSAIDLKTNASGILRHGLSPGGSLVMDRVTKDQVVLPGHVVVTAGWRSGKLASIYPRGIPIGVVSFAGQLDTDIYKQIEVDPFVDFRSLDSVIVLAARKRRR